MAYKPTRMDIIKRIIELRDNSYSIKKIARILGLSKNTVKKYLHRWEHGQVDLSSQNNSKVSAELFGKEAYTELQRDKTFVENLSYFCLELKRVGVTRQLLWEEHKLKYPDGFSYSRFCSKIKTYKAQQDVTLRLEHKNGHALTVDFAGKKLSWVNIRNGEVHYCEVLVCTLPASGHVYVCALASQKQEDFVYGINESLKYIVGIPKVILSDNLKSFVIKSDRYEPTFNNLSKQLATYYGIELQATRPRKPKDKAHVERHVAIVYNKIFGPLRDEEFHSIEALNVAVIERVSIINKKNYQGKNCSRKDKFEEEKKELTPLPKVLFQLHKSTRAKVQRNYHVILGEDKHQYSVPYQYVGKTTEIVYTRDTVEIYLNSDRIAVHQRDRRPHAYSSFLAHMPDKHQSYLKQKGWDATYFKNQAEKIGSNTLWAICTLLERKSLIEQTYNTCLGVLRLAKKYGNDRLEKACAKARTTHRINYHILSNILKNNMDKIEDISKVSHFNIESHENIRGSQNYP